MSFRKGKPKTGGRQKGVKNKLPFKLKEMLYNFLDDNYDVFVRSFANLSDSEKVKFYLKAAEFVIPKSKFDEFGNNNNSDPGFIVRIV